MTPTPITHLFVYGTLRPHDVRWPMLEPFVVDLGWDDTAPGRLFDTGLGYPAAVFDPDTADPDRELLDIEEDTVEGLYRRVSVMTGRGVRAWAYEYGAGLTLTPIDSGDPFERTPR